MLGLKSVVGLEDHNSSSLAVERILPINIMQRHQFSFEEYADMHLAYGAAGQNRAEAVRIYTARFPNRVIPAANTFVAIDKRVRETGSFAGHYLSQN